MNEIYDEGVGRAAQRTLRAVRVIAVLSASFPLLLGYYIGKRVADKWWQQEQMPCRLIWNVPSHAEITIDPNPKRNVWNNYDCPAGTTFVIDQWPDPKQANYSCIPRRALAKVRGIHKLVDGDVLTFTHHSPRPDNITDDYSGWDLCNEAKTHCWLRDPEGNLSGEERSNSKPEGKARGADGTVKAELHKKV